jgi:hypothetical protein
MSGRTFRQISIYLSVTDIVYRVSSVFHWNSLQALKFLLAVLLETILNTWWLLEWNLQLYVSSCHKLRNREDIFYDILLYIPSQIITKSTMDIDMNVHISKLFCLIYCLCYAGKWWIIQFSRVWKNTAITDKKISDSCNWSNNHCLICEFLDNWHKLLWTAD